MSAWKKINSQMKSFLDYLSGPFYVGMKLSSSQRFWSSPGHLSFHYVPPASADGPAKGPEGNRKSWAAQLAFLYKQWRGTPLLKKVDHLKPSSVNSHARICLPFVRHQFSAAWWQLGVCSKGVCFNGHKPQDPKRVRENQAPEIFLYFKKGGGRPISAKPGH